MRACSRPCTRCRASTSCPPPWRSLAYADCALPLPLRQAHAHADAGGSHPAGSRRAAGRCRCSKSAPARATSSACLAALGASVQIAGAARRDRRPGARQPARGRRRRGRGHLHRRHAARSARRAYDAIVLTASLPIYDAALRARAPDRRAPVRGRGHRARSCRPGWCAGSAPTTSSSQAAVRDLASRRSNMPRAPAIQVLAMSAVTQIDPAGLKAKMDARESFCLLDVREPWEVRDRRHPGQPEHPDARNSCTR